MRPVALAVIAQIVNYLDAPYVVDDALGFAVGPHCRTQCHNRYGHRFALTSLMEPVRIFVFRCFVFPTPGRSLQSGFSHFQIKLEERSNAKKRCLLTGTYPGDL